MISDRHGSLSSIYFFTVANERTCFASRACAFKSSGLITCLECTSDLKVTYIPILLDLYKTYTCKMQETNYRGTQFAASIKLIKGNAGTYGQAKYFPVKISLN